MGKTMVIIPIVLGYKVDSVWNHWLSTTKQQVQKKLPFFDDLSQMQFASDMLFDNPGPF